MELNQLLILVRRLYTPLSTATLQAIYNGRPILPKDATSRPQVIVKVGYFIPPFDNYGDKLNDIGWDFIQATQEEYKTIKNMNVIITENSNFNHEFPRTLADNDKVNNYKYSGW